MADTDDINPSHGEAEHEIISAALEIEQLDVNLYRSKSLWLPSEARGVFGGQVISQALLAATKSVPEEYAAHSYFLLSAKASQPIIYSVDRVRQGKTYATRAVKASQSGHIIFILLCSFQIPEPSRHRHQWPFPSNVPDPEQCETALQRYQRISALPGLGEKALKTLEGSLKDRMKSPIEQRFAARVKGEHGSIVAMHWMKARHIPKFGAPFQKAILAYLSDLQLLGLAAQTLGLRFTDERPERKLGMLSTVDHSIWYYNHEFDCADWLLYVMESSSSGMGRALVHGRLYTRDCTLVAVVSQEGVVRAAVENGTSKAKL
ncbi:hypothetical protein FRB99_005904 [Tulasnella sp. 403]|nr:hypothetical protein FRB99_005904 [Tulasnella sp. 403]